MRLLALVAIAGMCVAGSAASGAILISVPTVSGTLGAGSTFNFGPTDVDIIAPFDAGSVGDGAALRNGTVTYTFTVTGTGGDLVNRDVFSLAGAVAGNGTISVQTMVHDIATSDMLALDTFTVSSINPPPAARVIDFSRASAGVQVMVQLTLDAAETAGFELANFSLLEHNFGVVPTPASLALLGMGGIVAGRRRRA